MQNQSTIILDSNGKLVLFKKKEELVVKAKFGLFFDPMGDHNYTVKVARELEKRGFDSLLLPDHYMSPWTNEKLDSWTLLSHLAAEVKEIRLGTCVTPMPLRHPSILAKMVTTVDIVSNGRAILGIGAGWIKDEFIAYGLGWSNHKNRLEKTKEGVELILKLWSGMEKVNYDGKHYNLKDAIFLPKPIKKPHPPLWWGGSSSRILEMAAKYGQGWIPYILSAEDFGRNVNTIKSLLPSQNSEEEFTYAYCGPCVISKNPLEIEKYAPEAKREKADKLWLVGNPQKCVERIQEYLKNGANYIAPIFLDRKSTLESIELFADEVMPSFT
jgi:alkanesulfonate monooxygenase SsuD/methylene tetrahydromethanopterin reductase-like flavin-dependent oxidoreductase (luciferase family)